MQERVKAGERPGAPADADEETALVEQIARQKEEILRLRDLLIAKDAELGAARGRLAELTEHSARFAVAARSLQTRVPGFLRRAAAGLRRRG
jgi:hypothetical protein